MAELPEMDIYARKSAVLAAGNRLREVSTDEQVRQGYAYADRHGYRVRKVWVELGSAYADKVRPKFTKAVDALVAGEVPMLWTYMLDRFSRRGAEDVLKIFGHGRVIFDYDRLDSGDERDRERIIMEAERARSYSARLSHRVRDVKASLREQGFWVGGSVPWGLRLDKATSKVEPDPQPAGGHSGLTRAAKGREMGVRLLGGESLRRVCTSYNAMRIPAARGGAWTPGSMLVTVQTAAYAGLQPDHSAEDGRYRSPNTGKLVSIGTGLLTVAEQDQLRKILRKGPRRGAAAENSAPKQGVAKHLLTTLIYCAGITEDRNMWHTAYVTGGKYVCSRAHLVDQHDVCPSPVHVTREVVEKYVAEKWLHVVGALEPTDPLAHVIADRWAALQAPTKTQEHREAEEAVKAAKALRLRLQKAFRMGAYEGAEDMFRDEMREATSAVQEAQAELDKHAAPVPDMGFIDDPLVLREAWDAAPLARKRELLALAIDRVWVCKKPKNERYFHGDTRVVIDWATVE